MKMKYEMERKTEKKMRNTNKQSCMLKKRN